MKVNVTLENAMANTIAALRCSNANMSNDKIVELATAMVKERYPEMFEEAASEPKQDEVPAYEETAVDGDPTSNNSDFSRINLGSGAVIDTDQINKGIAESYDHSNPARGYLQQQIPPMVTPTSPAISMNADPQPQQVPVQQVPVMGVPMMGQMPPVGQPVPMQPQQTPQNPQGQQFPVNPIFEKPLHKVDEKPKPKPPVAEEDKVDVELEDVNFKGFQKPPVIKRVPDPVNHKLENPAPVSRTVDNLFDNSAIIQQYPKVPLKQIEQIANNNGCSVAFEEYPYSGLITVMAVNEKGKGVLPKSFTIDTGMIIDKRMKLFAACPRFNQEQILEFAPVYELMMIDSKNHGRKVLDEKLLNDIFYAGLGNISKREMFSESYKALNRKVALISMPTKRLNKEQRNALQGFLVKMDNEGYFDKALSIAPGSRFVFLNMDQPLDPNHLGTFTLINEGVPMFYGTMANKVNPVIIEVVDGNVTIRSNGQVVNPDTIPAYKHHPDGCNCGHC